MPSDFILDQSPLDSSFFVLTPADASALAAESTLAIQGRDILVELEAWDIANSVSTTFYFGSRGYNHPTAPGYYWPRLSQPLSFRRDLYSAATTGGASRVSFGEMRLVNRDGGLDYLRDYGLQGQRVRMLIGRAGDGLSNSGDEYDSFEPLITGRVQRVLFEIGFVTVILRDRLQDFAQSMQVNTYLGDNVLPDGIEGTADIKGKPKPLVFGAASNVTPVCVNTSKLIWQLNDGPDGSVEFLNVYDGGVALDAEADYPDMATMLSTAPTAGYYRLLSTPTGSYFRLGASPASTVTANVYDRVAVADNTAARVALRIASRTPETGEGGITDDDVNWDDVDALDIANPASVGIWVNGGETYASALDAVLGSVGAWYGFDRFGIFRMQRLELPTLPYVTTFRIASIFNPVSSTPALSPGSGTYLTDEDSPYLTDEDEEYLTDESSPAETFATGGFLGVGEYDIVDYRFVPSNDPEKGIPSWKVELDYARNWTVQPESSVLGAVPQDRRNFLALASRTTTEEDSGVQTIYPFAVKKKVATLLILEAFAEAEAARLLEIFSEARDFLEIDLILSSDLIALVDIGAVINIVLPRLGYEAGKIMRVTGMQYNAANGIVTLACWG